MGVFASTGKKGTVYRYKFDLDGQVYRGTLKTDSLAKAIEAEKKIRQAFVAVNNDAAPSDSPRLRDFISDDYLPWSKQNKRSFKDDVSVCKTILEFFDDYRLDEITTKQCRKFQTVRRDTPTRRDMARSNSTVNSELSVLSRILQLAVDEEFLTNNPSRTIKRLRPASHVIRYLTNEEENRLMANLHGDRAHLRPVVLIALHTGMRKMELLSLKRWQIKFEIGERGVIELPKTKSGKVRVIPMNSLVREELLLLCRGLAEHAPVFKSMKSENSLTEIKKGFSYALRAAEINHFRFHDLRHTFGTRLAEANVPLHQIAELMGHSDLRMTMRYIHASGSGKFTAVETLVNRRKNI